MSGQYAEYRSLNKKHKRMPTSSPRYAKKFGTQFIVCIVLLSSVYLIKQSDSTMSHKVGEQIKSMLTYEVNTDKFALWLDKIIWQQGNENTSNQEESQTHKENEEQTNDQTNETQIQQDI